MNNLAAVVNKMGEETKVIKAVFVYALLLTLVTAIIAMVFLKFMSRNTKEIKLPSIIREIMDIANSE